MGKKRCIRKPQPNTGLTSVKNDLVLSSDRCQISVRSNRLGSLGKRLPVAESLVTIENDQKEEKCMAEKIDRVSDSNDTGDMECHQTVACEYSEYEVDGNADKLTSSSVNEEARTGEPLFHSICSCCSQSNFHSDNPEETLLHISNINDAAAQKSPAYDQSCPVVNQGFDRNLCGPAFNHCDSFNSEVGWNLSNRSSWLSPDNACHVDMVLDQLFEASLKEKQDSLYLPPNMLHVTGNKTSENMYQAEVKQGFTVESLTSDLKPSVREKSCIISNSTHVRSRNVKLGEHSIKRPVLSAVAKGDYSEVFVKRPMCCDSDTYYGTGRRKEQNRILYQKQNDVPTYLVNHGIDSGSVGDLQPSVRVRNQSLCQHRENSPQKSPADSNRNEEEIDLAGAQDIEKCTGLKAVDTNTAEIADNEGLGEYDKSENVCNELVSSEYDQTIVKGRNNSLRIQGQSVICGTLVDNIRAQEKHSNQFSNRRRFSKALEQSDCHGNNSSGCQQHRDKGAPSCQSETKPSNTSLNLIDRKSGTLSMENVSEIHRHKTNDLSVLSESKTKRKRFNSGPDSSRKRSKHALGEIGLETTENFSTNTNFLLHRNRTKLKNNHKSKIRVCKDKTEHSVIHDIHKTIAESSIVGAKVTACELNETDDSETVREADLENIIPLDVLSCGNFGKRKVRLKQEKAKGALYRQVSSDGIWRSVNSKY